jgi:glycosyltransferase involved in cell wall biosynthesis
MEKVSIIIPTYNRKKLVRNAIKSALMQTYPTTEIIVIDDNSGYDIYKVLEEFKGKIRIIKNEKNIGPLKTLNKGIKESNGDYITILNDDDIFHPKKIERQINIFNKRKNIGLVYCPELKKVGNKFIFKPAKREKNHWIGLSHQNPIIVTPLIKKDCFSVCGVFDTSIGYHGDKDLWYRIGKKFKLDFDEYPSYIVYNPHITRMSKQMEKICESKKNLYNKHKDDFKDRDILFSYLHYELAYIYLVFGHYKEFFKQFKISVGKNPVIIKKFFNLYQDFCKIGYKQIKIDNFLKKIVKKT